MTMTPVDRVHAELVTCADLREGDLFAHVRHAFGLSVCDETGRYVTDATTFTRVGATRRLPRGRVELRSEGPGWLDRVAADRPVYRALRTRNGEEVLHDMVVEEAYKETVRGAATA